MGWSLKFWIKNFEMIAVFIILCFYILILFYATFSALKSVYDFRTAIFYYITLNNC